MNAPANVTARADRENRGNRAHEYEYVPIPAFGDNYIWTIADGHAALVVDPGEAAPVRHYLAKRGWRLAAILLTHHHHDHVGGVAQLLADTSASAPAGANVPVYGPADESIAHVTHGLSGGERVHVDAPALDFDVIAVPGHTRGHLAYFQAAAGSSVSSGSPVSPHSSGLPGSSGSSGLSGSPDSSGSSVSPSSSGLPGSLGSSSSSSRVPHLFCGDTLFSCGCGRIFEGTPAQMLASLDALAALPDDTRVHCAHEYTLSNIRFALACDPDNAQLHAWRDEATARRAQGVPTLPTTLARERAVNPFLRVDDPAIQALLARELHQAVPDRLGAFTLMREWKNRFK